MPYYRHYSFDLWLTLIKSNPGFKAERARYFFENYNPLKKSREEVATIFRRVDRMVNSINEKAGKNIDADEMYLMVISMLNDYSCCFKDIDMTALEKEMEVLLMENLPVVYNNDTKGVLEHLKEKNNSSINILSNTGFIRGVTLRKVLKLLGLDQFVDFQIYSDEHGLSKPSSSFFLIMLNKVLADHADYSLEDIVHVGDNPVADITGARSVGINSLLINSNETSITSLIC